MYESCLAKQQKIKESFMAAQGSDERYQMIIDLGKSLPPLDPKFKVAENLVKGCQSQMWLHSCSENNKMVFEVQSDALISQGLGALLVLVYSNESPETVLKCAPSYLDELQIAASLSPNRANGLYSLHLHMKQDALRALTMTQQSS